MRKVMMALAAIVALGSCAKDGKDGVDGKDASIVVKNLRVWGSTWDIGTSSCSADFLVTEITSTAMANSVIQLYRKSGQSLIAMPLTLPGSGYTITENFAVSPGEVSVMLVCSDGAPRYYSTDTYYQLVIADYSATKSQIHNKLQQETGLSIIEPNSNL